MELFKCEKKELLANIKTNKLTTPLGTVRFDISIDKILISGSNPVYCYSISNDGYILRWEEQKYEAELLISKPIIKIPSHMKVEKCWAAMWRLKANECLSNCNFTSIWEQGYTWITGGSNTGEHLEAATWDNGKTYVTIGTHNGEYLAARAKMNDNIPQRLEKDLDDIGLTENTKESIRVPIPSLLQEELCQIHFIVAWADNEISTWYEVDMNCDQVLSGANCS